MELLVCTYPKTCDFKDCICLQNGLKPIDMQNQAPEILCQTVFQIMMKMKKRTIDNIAVLIEWGRVVIKMLSFSEVNDLKNKIIKYTTNT
jgi:DNA helicase IV